MNSRHMVRCQNISANVNQLGPEQQQQQQFHTPYKNLACMSCANYRQILNKIAREYFHSRKDFIKKVAYLLY